MNKLNTILSHEARLLHCEYCVYVPRDLMKMISNYLQFKWDFGKGNQEGHFIITDNADGTQTATNEERKWRSIALGPAFCEIPPYISNVYIRVELINPGNNSITPWIGVMDATFDQWQDSMTHAGKKYRGMIEDVGYTCAPHFDGRPLKVVKSHPMDMFYDTCIDINTVNIRLCMEKREITFQCLQTHNSVTLRGIEANNRLVTSMLTAYASPSIRLVHVLFD